MKPLDTTDIQLHGEIAERLQRAVHNMGSWVGTRSGPGLSDDPGDYCWGADFQGRWTDAMAVLSKCVHVPDDVLESVADSMLGFQRPDGNFHTQLSGTVQNGNSRALAALVEMYRLKGDRKYLRAAEKLADWYARNFTAHKQASPWLTMALEAIVQLWQVTGRPQHLRLAQRFVHFASRPCQQPFPEHSHAHSTVLSVRGMLAYAIATGDRRCLPLVRRVWTRMSKETVWATGGMPEVFTNSIEADEPCGTADWLTINLQLWQLTRNEVYIEAAERALLNHLWFNQLPNGGFSSTSNIEQGFRGLEAWWCCSMHAPLAVEKLTRFVCAHTAGGIWLNFFVSADMTIRLRDNLAVRIEQRTDLPRGSATRLVVSPDRDATFSLRLRLPRWARAARITVNGKRQAATEQRGYCHLRRQWRAGDVVDVVFSMRMTATVDVQGDHDKWMEAPVEIDGVEQKAKRIIVSWGPLVLAVFRPTHGNDLTWVYRGGYNEVLDAGGMPGASRSCRNYVGLDGVVYSDDAGNKTRVGPIIVRTSPGGVQLRWKESLGGGRAELRYNVIVRPGLPVCIDEQETLTVKASDKRPCKVDALLLAGTRFMERAEQYHDTYKRLWKYEYPPVRAAANGGRLRTLRDDATIESSGSLVMDNRLCRVAIEHAGDVKRVVSIRREDWAGVYFSPLPATTRKLRRRTQWVVRRRLQFSCEDYAERTYMPPEWTHSLMTQPINEA